MGKYLDADGLGYFHTKMGTEIANSYYNKTYMNTYIGKIEVIETTLAGVKEFLETL